MKAPFNLLALITLLCFAIPAQSQINLNNIAVETGFGYSGAIEPYSKVFNSNFSGMRHFDFGVRYMFNEKFGAKVFYKIDNFVNDPGGKVGIKYNTFGISGIYNVGKQIGLTYLTRDKVGVNLHIDGGISYAYLKNPSYVREKVGVASIGITPMYRLSNKVALSTDLTYNYTLKQHYGFDGVLLDPAFKGQNGSFYNFTVGLIYYIGENKYHSDWY